MSKKRVIITGCSCQIGARLAKRLLKSNYEVVGLAHHPSPTILDTSYSEYEFNLLDQEQNFFKYPDCDVLIHFAWCGTRGLARNDEDLQKQCYSGSMQLFEHFAKSRKLDTVITIGSQAEYGSKRGAMLTTEEYPSEPDTEYGKWKLQLYKNASKLFSKEIRIIEPRLWSVYGPQDRIDTLIMYLMQKLNADEPCEMGPCEQLWNYAFVDDVARDIAALILKETPSGIYNIASSDTRPLREFVEEMKVVLDSKSELKFGAKEQATNTVVTLNPSIEKLIKAIGPREEINFKTGISIMNGARKPS